MDSKNHVSLNGILKSTFVLFLLSFILCNYCVIKVVASGSSGDLPGDINQVVRLKSSKDGDFLCFDINVKESNARIRYRTIGWEIKINGIGIIKKYMASELSSETFQFYISDLESEYLRQYGENSSEYKAIVKALYIDGGTITFDALNTYSINGVMKGSIIDNPIYKKSWNYNYRGNVYNTLSGIRNAQSWSSHTKNVDLPKYYGIAYSFSAQPHVDGVININYIDDKGKQLKASKRINSTFAITKEKSFTIDIPDISGYIFDKWVLIRDKNKVTEYGEDIEVVLSKSIKKVDLNIMYIKASTNPDLKIIGISQLVYNEDTKVVTSIKIKNVGSVDVSPDNTVTVKVTIGNDIYTKNIDVGRNKEVIVPFVWKTPKTNSTRVLSFEIIVNEEHKYRERDYLNNYFRKLIIIKPLKSVELRDFPRVPIVPLPEGENNYSCEWTEWRFDKWVTTNGKRRPIYKEKSFYMRLVVDAEASESRMKSGYGFSISVPVKVETNYDKPEYIIAPQNVQMFLPETQYKEFLLLEKTKKGEVWQLSINKTSVLATRKHYIPIWYPDNLNYCFNVTATDAFCPGGGLNKTVNAQIYIDGNMYEDDYTKREWIR